MPQLKKNLTTKEKEDLKIAIKKGAMVFSEGSYVRIEYFNAELPININWLIEQEEYNQIQKQWDI